MHKEKALDLKKEGNEKFGMGEFQMAIEFYTKALIECPPSFNSERAIFYANRAASYMKLVCSGHGR